MTEEEIQKIFFQFSDLRERINRVSAIEEKAMQAHGWIDEYNALLKHLLDFVGTTAQSEITEKFLEIEKPPFSMSVPHYFPVNVQVVEQVSGKIYRLLLDFSPQFFKTEKKKMEVALQRAEADRRKAVADFKGEGKRIEDIDKARGKI